MLTTLISKCKGNFVPIFLLGLLFVFVLTIYTRTVATMRSFEDNNTIHTCENWKRLGFKCRSEYPASATVATPFFQDAIHVLEKDNCVYFGRTRVMTSTRIHALDVEKIACNS